MSNITGTTERPLLTLPSRQAALSAAPPRPGTITIPPRPGTLTAARLKISTVLDATELLAIPVPEGKPRITLRIRLPDRTITADIAAKSLRKAQTAIRDIGADNIVLVLQGHLAAGDVIAEAGPVRTAQSGKAGAIP